MDTAYIQENKKENKKRKIPFIRKGFFVCLNKKQKKIYNKKVEKIKKEI